jgi:hypothetical protein
MSPKLIGALAIITLITTVAAVVAVMRQPEATILRSAGEPAFPALREQPDAVTKAIVRTPDEQITLVREAPGRWITPERYGYPVSTDAVRSLIIEIADMRLVEAKTSRPERYDRLELNDLDAKGASSRLVRLEDAKGNVLAEAIFGKQRQRLTGLQSSGIYLRRPGEAQSWLASGGPQIQASVQDWLETTIVDLPADGLKRIEIRPQDGEAYTLAREAESGQLQLSDLREGEQLKQDDKPGQLARTFSGLSLSDVKPADEIAWPREATRVEVETLGGLQLEARLALIDDQPWLAIERVEGPATGAGSKSTEPGVPRPDQPGQAQAAETPGAASPTGTAEDGQAPPDAQALAQRTRGWVYQVGRPVYERLTQPRKAWLQDGEGTS